MFIERLTNIYREEGRASWSQHQYTKKKMGTVYKYVISVFAEQSNVSVSVGVRRSGLRFLGCSQSSIILYNPRQPLSRCPETILFEDRWEWGQQRQSD